ncbi:L-2-hydroxyglutarate oxidase [Pelobacter seleniigenes]|uniref:L-2-hydroxyglutarate oxidase n=1 Tax=Pelobacter seleniigenes TaxID=407188 RepID=UPI0004A76F82|nr:L-2-hydroxyglutarate oxidase [Pelobacter seleniigenes]
MPEYDFIIIGGGIIGLATARQLQKEFHGAKIAILEKEALLALHQTGHNSGVVHAGVYYAPGSLKARFCREGNRDTKEFCREHGIPCKEIGKLLVATDDRELERMQQLLERCRLNGIETEVLDRHQLQELEPNVSGVGATWVPATGIVDFRKIAAKLAELVIAAGGEIHTNCLVTAITEQAGVSLTTSLGRFSGRLLIGCGGLFSDRLVRMLGREPGFKIVPFRGEYFQLPVAKRSIVSRPIYPIPNPELPFLGIHLTPMIDGSLTVGPNATLALAREGYRRWTFNLRDLAEMATYPGLYRLIMKYPLATLTELKNSLYRPGYLKLVTRYCPALRLTDLCPYPAGVRAQAVKADGTTLDDFLFVEGSASLIVGNAPSPAATSAMPIARHICEQVKKLHKIK